MAKVIVYNVYTQALETFYLEENDPMPSDHSPWLTRLRRSAY